MKTFQTLTIFGSSLFLYLLLAVGAAHSATYYTATNGSDGNVGSSTQPFRTIGRGVKALRPGDTLLIRGGTYVEPSLNNQIPDGSSWSEPVTVKGNPGETVVFQPTTKVPGINIRLARRFIRIEGIGIDMGGIADTDGLKIHENSSDIELLNLDIRNIHGNRGSAIVIGNGSQRVTVRGSKLHDIVQTPVSRVGNHGMYWRGSFGLIENNEFYNIQGYGIQLYSAARGVNDNVVRYNVFRNVGQPSISSEGGIALYSGVRNKIHGNLIYNSYGSGIVVRNNDNQILNNTIYKSALKGIDVQTGANNLVQNNIVFGNGSNLAISAKASATISSNNLTTDPSFVDPANGNFRLQSDSPAIDKGAVVPEIRFDLDGLARPQGTSFDIGAYEYRATTVTGTAPVSPSGLQEGPR